MLGGLWTRDDMVRIILTRVVSRIGIDILGSRRIRRVDGAREGVD